MKLQILVFFAFLSFVCLETETGIDKETDKETHESKVQRGKDLAKKAFYAILFGEGKGNGYRDLYLDTNKSLLEYFDTFDQSLTIDGYIRVFFQSLIILITNKRHDLIPSDYYGKIKLY